MHFHRYGWRINWILTFPRRFLRILADIATIFQERIERSLQFKHPAWLDDIIIVPKETI